MKRVVQILFALTLALAWLPARPAVQPAPLDLPEGLQPSPPRPGVLEQIEEKGGSLPDFTAAAARGIDGGSLVASPPTGDFNLLVVMVDFSDNTGTPDGPTAGPTAIENLVFGASNSVKDYYNEISYTDLTFKYVDGDRPSEIDWLRAPQPYSWYVNANYGFGTYPQNLQGIVAHVLPTLDPYVDFLDYDNDGDGFVDGIIFTFAGYGAEITYPSDPNRIWSSAWNMTDGAGPGPLLTAEGVYVDRFGFDPEHMGSASPNDQTIGIFCHEIGHVFFGLPDLYDTQDPNLYSVSAGVGAWSLMGSGNWNGPSWDGSRPAWPDAWSRSVMGFETPTLLYGNATSYPFTPVESLGGPVPGQQVVRLESPNLGPHEYFLVEYRDNSVASYDNYLPGSGLLIWHIDEEKWNAWEGNDFECLATPCCGCPVLHPLVALAQADGNLDLENFNNYGDATDPFNVQGQSFNAGTNPESGSYLVCRDSCIAVTLTLVWPQYMNADINVVCTNPTMACLDLSVSELPGWALAGQEATYEVTVRNCGNTNEFVDLSVPFIPDGWPVSFFDLNTGQPIVYPPTGFVSSGGAWRLGMRVGVPVGTDRGQAFSYLLTVNGSSPGATDSENVDTRVPECILLVDDDPTATTPDPIDFYRMALDNPAYDLSYDEWDVAVLGPPDPGALAAHDMVIWFTGMSRMATLTIHDQMALADYLDGGGNLFLSSQDYLYDVGHSTFGLFSLHIMDFTDDISLNQIQGVAGSIFEYIPPSPLFPQTPFNDALIPLPPAEPAFEYIPNLPTQQFGGITYDSGTSKVLFLAWPFENLPPPSANDVMAITAGWMGVPPAPLASFTVTPALACSASPITFTNTSMNATQYLWDFGDGITSTLTSPTHTYTVSAPVTYTVMLQASNCCGGPIPFHQIVPVTPLPTAGFDASAAAALVSQTLTFTNTSLYADTYLWDFGDGVTSTLTDVTHAYTISGTYTVTLMATNACQTSASTQAFGVYEQVEADFQISIDQVRIGQRVYFTSQSQNALTYLWDFGDGVGTSTLPNPSYTYASAGTYTVTLTASNPASSDMAWIVVDVEEGPPLSSIYLPTLNRGAVSGLKAFYKP